jgi:aminoglycoside phosphotransferase family enzyme
MFSSSHPMHAPSPNAVPVEASPSLDAKLRFLRSPAAHGATVCDLRPEHVCMTDPPVIIDCLEFNAPLRQVDPFDEVAFLGFECGLAGADWIAPRLVAGLSAALDDHPLPA